MEVVNVETGVTKVIIEFTIKDLQEIYDRSTLDFDWDTSKEPQWWAEFVGKIYEALKAGGSR